MYGTMIAVFAFALIAFTSVSALFLKRNGAYGAKTDVAMLSAALLHKIHITAAFSSVPFAFGQLCVVIFTEEEKARMWLTLTIIILWGIALLIGTGFVLRKNKGKAKKTKSTLQ